MTTQERVYLDAQAACGLKVGDWVRVTHSSESGDGGWECCQWSLERDQYVGKAGKVKKIDNGGVWIWFPHSQQDSWGEVWLCFPYYILEKTEKPACQFNPFDKVLVRDNKNQHWIPSFFFYYNDGSDFPYVCMTGYSYAQCIPYEGNEHLAGTTGEPE